MREAASRAGVTKVHVTLTVGEALELTVDAFPEIAGARRTARIALDEGTAPSA